MSEILENDGLRLYSFSDVSIIRMLMPRRFNRGPFINRPNPDFALIFNGWHASANETPSCAE